MKKIYLFQWQSLKICIQQFEIKFQCTNVPQGILLKVFCFPEKMCVTWSHVAGQQSHLSFDPVCLCCTYYIEYSFNILFCGEGGIILAGV